MTPMKLLLAALLTTIGMATAHAAPVAFSVSPVSFLPGAGYGVDANEVGGTLLDVSFTAAPGLQAFVLNAPGDSASFNFGSITLNEAGLINANETDSLGVLAVFLFAQPSAGAEAVTATGSAVTGLVGDLDIDLTIAWNPLDVAFGNGGLFRVTMDSVNFRFAGQTHDVDATIRLLSAPQPVNAPGTLALMGAALVAAAAALGRRRQLSVGA